MPLTQNIHRSLDSTGGTCVAWQRLRFRPSLRDEPGLTFRKPWVETHGDHHNVATRRGPPGLDTPRNSVTVHGNCPNTPRGRDNLEAPERWTASCPAGTMSSSGFPDRIAFLLFLQSKDSSMKASDLRRRAISLLLPLLAIASPSLAASPRLPVIKDRDAGRLGLPGDLVQRGRQCADPGRSTEPF